MISGQPLSSTGIFSSANVVLLDTRSNTTYEAELDLRDGGLVNCVVVPGVQPLICPDEMVEAEEAVLRSSEFQDKMKEHYGIEDMKDVVVDIWSAGTYFSHQCRFRVKDARRDWFRPDSGSFGLAFPQLDHGPGATGTG